MKANFIKKNYNKLCRIKSSWLIFTAILAALYLPSCVPAKNMETGERLSRGEQKTNQPFSGGLVHGNKKKKNATKKDGENDKKSQIADFEEKMFKNNSQKNSEIISTKSENGMKNNSKTLPSLKEQIDKINKNQFEIGNNIDDIREEMIEVKDLLKNIHNSKSIENNSIIKEGRFLQNDNEVETGTFILSDDNAIQKQILLDSDEEATANKNEQKLIKKGMIKNSPKPSKKSQVKLNSFKSNTSVQNNSSKKSSIDNNISAANPDIVKNNLSDNENDFSEIISNVANGKINEAAKSINLKLKSTKNPSTISDCHYWLGECNFQQKNYMQAINNYKNVLSGQGDKKDVAQAKLAECYMMLGKNDEAKTAFQALLKNYPKSSQTPKAKKMLQQL